MKRKKILISIFLILSISNIAAQKLDYSKRKEATKFTIDKNKEVEKELDFSNKQDFIEAKKGFIATWPNNQ